MSSTDFSEAQDPGSKSSPIALLLPNQPLPLPTSSGPLDFFPPLYANYSLRKLAKSRGYSNVEEMRREARKVKQGEEKVGTIVESWDWVVVWDQDFVDADELQSWRSRSDPLADQALESLKYLELNPPSSSATDSPTGDLLSRLTSKNSTLQKSPSNNSDSTSTSHISNLSSFWEAIDRRPPIGCGALNEDWYKEREKRWENKWENLGGLERLRELCGKVEEDRDQEQKDWESWKPPSTSTSKRSEIDPETEDLLQEMLREELHAEELVLESGRNVFYRYAGPLLLSLLHFSLAGGFASPRITNVLKETGYLVPGHTNMKNKEKLEALVNDSEELTEKLADSIPEKTSNRTWRRLLETTQFVLDCMESKDSLKPPSLSSSKVGGLGWESSIRVRLLHSSVRSRITKSSSRYSIEADGIPINQEDLAATLASFSSAPLWSIQRMGMSPSIRERKDFISIWRHIGFYMGVEPKILKKCFGNERKADRFLFSSVRHLFGKEEIGKALEGPTIPVLKSCADRPPFHTKLKIHFALARHLLGPSLAQALSIPETSFLTYINIQISFLTMRLPLRFGQYYPIKRWEADRLRLARPLLRRLIVWSLGGRKTKFSYVGLPAGDFDNQDPGEGEKIPLDPKTAGKLVKEWKGLLIEAGVVSALLVVGVVALGIKLVW